MLEIFLLLFYTVTIQEINVVAEPHFTHFCLLIANHGTAAAGTDATERDGQTSIRQRQTLREDQISTDLSYQGINIPHAQFIRVTSHV